jgi:predicted RNA-binding Zn ribbon-like protein
MHRTPSQERISKMPRAAPQAAPPSTSHSTHETVARRGALALEFINTVTVERGKQRDVLASPDDLARWWQAVCARYPDQCLTEGVVAPIAWTSDLLAAIKALRRALRALITQVVDQQNVEEADLRPVNEVLAMGSAGLERTERGSVKAVTRLRDTEQGSVLVPVALSALRLFTEADWRRLHQCKHDRCVIFFYDTTKSGTRRWCSPGCMNRARSIQHYRLTKKTAGQESR